MQITTTKIVIVKYHLGSVRTEVEIDFVKIYRPEKRKLPSLRPHKCESLDNGTARTTL